MPAPCVLMNAYAIYRSLQLQRRVASAVLRLETTSTCRACPDVPTSYPRLLSTKPYPDTRTLSTVFTFCVSDVTNK